MDKGPTTHSPLFPYSTLFRSTDSLGATKDTVTTVSISTVTDPVYSGNNTNAEACGTAASSETIDLSFSDGTPAHDFTDSTTATGGTRSFTVEDLSGLDDGPIS